MRDTAWRESDGLIFASAPAYADVNLVHRHAPSRSMVDTITLVITGATAIVFGPWR
jgi:hypothetical protein